MIFAAVLAGGSGSRMGATALPKQFLPLGEKPVLIHTLEPFLQIPQIDAVFVLTPQDWIEYTREQLHTYLPDADVEVTAAGATRNDTLLCAIRYVCAFVTKKMIEENIAAVREDGACDTVIPATDTIVRSADGAFIADIPPRSELYQGQTPQSFRLLELQRTVESLSPEETLSLTDACKIYTVRGKKVRLVAGSPSNMKITYADDLPLAEAILNARK